MINKKKVVITGSGLLASNIALYKKESWDVYILARNPQINIHNIKTIKSDFTNQLELLQTLSKISPDFIIHTAGLANVEECEKNYDLAYFSNVELTKKIGHISKEISSKFIHISTDHFTKQELEYSSEEDVGVPVNVYAETKLLAEKFINNELTSANIIRTNFYDWGREYGKSFSDFIISNLIEKKPITLFDDVFYTPILIDELVDTIEALYVQELSGTYNVSSNKKISKYDFGIALSKIFNLDHSLIKKGSIQDFKMTKRPRNMSLSNNKLVKDLGPSFDFNFQASIEKLKKKDPSIIIV